MQYESQTKTPADDAHLTVESGDSDHVHRWRIDAQSGPESAGHCSCGEARQFANSYTSEQTNSYRRGPRRR